MRNYQLVLPACILLLFVSISLPAADGPQGLPRGFRGIILGMSMEEVKEALLADPNFRYRGDPDVSLLPSPNKYLIETEGASFIQRAFFQFHDGKLYSFTLLLDPRRIDYYTMYTSFVKKYGNQTRLSPSDSVWESSSTRLSLERPVNVKYIDLPVFEKLREAGRAMESNEMLSRESFIKEF